MFSFERHKRSIYVYRDDNYGENTTVLAISPNIEETDNPINDGKQCYVDTVNFLHKFSDKKKGSVASLMLRVKYHFGYFEVLDRQEDTYSNDVWIKFKIQASVDEVRDYLITRGIKHIHKEIAHELLWLKNFFSQEAENEFKLSQ